MAGRCRTFICAGRCTPSPRLVCRFVIETPGHLGPLEQEALLAALHDVFAPKPAQVSQILDLIFEDDRLNVYAGEREVRPPGAPTREPRSGFGRCSEGGLEAEVLKTSQGVGSRCFARCSES